MKIAWTAKRGRMNRYGKEIAITQRISTIVSHKEGDGILRMYNTETRGAMDNRKYIKWKVAIGVHADNKMDKYYSGNDWIVIR